MNPRRALFGFLGLMLAATAGYLLTSSSGSVGPGRYRDGRGRIGRAGLPAAGPTTPTYTLFTEWNFAIEPQLPPCTAAESCVAQCKVKTDGSAGHCVDANGADLAGYTEGVGAAFAPSYVGGVYAWSGINDTSSATAVPRISNAAIRSMFGGDHTIVIQGEYTALSDATPWFAMVTDGTNQLQARIQGGFQCLEGPGGVTSTASSTINGLQMMSCTVISGVLTARAQGVLGTPTATTIGAITGTPSFYFGGGTGGCCTPGGSMGGSLVSVTLYSVGKSEAWHKATDARAWGVPATVTGPTNTVGTVGTIVLGEDDIRDSGYAYFYSPGAYIQSPALGIRSRNAIRNYWGSDPFKLSDDTDITLSVVLDNVASGPSSLWKNAAEVDSLTATAGLGKQGGTAPTATDAGWAAGWGNLSVICSASSASAARLAFKIVGPGVVDAGSAYCDIDCPVGSYARLPVGGCAAYITATTSVSPQIQLRDGGTIRVGHRQFTATAERETMTTNGTGMGSSWLELDGGGVSSGANQGKIEIVYSLLYSSSIMGADKTSAKALSAYPFDAYNIAASHDAILWHSTTGTLSDGGPGQSALDAIVYGSSAGPENQFSVGGQYAPGIYPIEVAAGQLYVASLEWTPSGTWSGGGTGCRAKVKFDTCSDSTTCHAVTVVGSNTGTTGECPLYTDLIDLGTRIAGSSPSSVYIHDVRVYH